MKKTESYGNRRVRFQFNASPGSQVYISGTFNNWDTKAKRLNNNGDETLYTGSLLLSPGTYEYKFVVNGKWHIDPECPRWVQNEFGSLNSLLTIN